VLYYQNRNIKLLSLHYVLRVRKLSWHNYCLLLLKFSGMNNIVNELCITRLLYGMQLNVNLYANKTRLCRVFPVMQFSVIFIYIFHTADIQYILNVKPLAQSIDCQKVVRKPFCNIGFCRPVLHHSVVILFCYFIFDPLGSWIVCLIFQKMVWKFHYHC